MAWHWPVACPPASFSAFLTEVGSCWLFISLYSGVEGWVSLENRLYLSLFWTPEFVFSLITWDNVPNSRIYRINYIYRSFIIFIVFL